jgi:hypothetical protein
MAIKILMDSFVACGKNCFDTEIGLVLVDFGRGRTVMTPASKIGKAINAAGFVGRYRTSPKAWLAHVSAEPHYADEGVYAHFGRDDRSGRFNKRDAISFEPENYEKLCRPAFWITC